MDRKDPFIDWLKNKILSNPQEPPVQGWEKVADSLDLEESWEAINEDLDLETVWEKVDSRLHRFENLQLFERAAYAISGLAAIVLLLGLWLQEPGMGSQLPSQEQDPHAVSLTEEQAAGQPAEVNRKPVEKVENRTVGEKGGGRTSFPHSSREEEKAETAEALRQKKNKRINWEESRRNKTATSSYREKEASPSFDPGALIAESGTSYTQGRSLRLLNGKGFMENALLGRELPKVSLSDSVSTVSEIQAVEKAGFDYRFPAMVAGLGSVAKLSWLMNNKTLTAMEKSSLVTAVPAIHTDLFLTYGLRITERSMLQADGYLLDWGGQRYREYRKGTYGEVEDKLLYRSLGLSLRKAGRQVGFGSMPLFSQYGAGIYGGVLRKAAEQSVDGLADTREEYSKWHFGLQAGYAYDLYLNENLLLSYGLQGRMDLLNTYSGTDLIPANFRRTRKLSLDFTISLKYVLKK